MRIDCALVTFNKVLGFHYTNYKGETAYRKVRAMSVFFGTTQWHPEPQWMMQAIDLDKGEYREFAMKDMSDVQEVVQ